MKIFASTALALALTTLSALPASAQQNQTDRPRPTVNQLTAYDDARIARLKADLRLTQEQESDWGKLESTLKSISKRRAERRIAAFDEAEKRDKDKPLTPADRLRRRADMLTHQAEDLRAIADASDPLVGKLNDDQRRRVEQAIQSYAWTGHEDDRPRRRRRGYN